MIFDFQVRSARSGVPGGLLTNVERKNKDGLLPANQSAAIQGEIPPRGLS